jgi:transcriptional regulator with XRE-family HTH domain
LGVLIGLDEGFSSARISRYETGVHEPTFEIAQRLAGVLGVPVAYLYCDEDWLADLLLRLARLTPTRRALLIRWLNEAG